MRAGSVTRVNVVALAMLLAGCHSSSPRGPVLAVVYVGPATLNLRSDIPTQSSTVATVKHGDRLQILLRVRSFLKVRTPNGAEGWTDQRQLLGADEMAGLKVLSGRAAAMPSQGRATIDADLRMHILPSQGSPSILTLKQNDQVDPPSVDWEKSPCRSSAVGV